MTEPRPPMELEAIKTEEGVTMYRPKPPTKKDIEHLIEIAEEIHDKHNT